MVSPLSGPHIFRVALQLLALPGMLYGPAASWVVLGCWPRRPYSQRLLPCACAVRVAAARSRADGGQAEVPVRRVLARWSRKNQHLRSGGARHCFRHLAGLAGPAAGNAGAGLLVEPLASPTSGSGRRSWRLTPLLLWLRFADLSRLGVGRCEWWRPGAGAVLRSWCAGAGGDARYVHVTAMLAIRRICRARASAATRQPAVPWIELLVLDERLRNASQPAAVPGWGEGCRASIIPWTCCRTGLLAAQTASSHSSHPPQRPGAAGNRAWRA